MERLSASHIQIAEYRVITGDKQNYRKRMEGMQCSSVLTILKFAATMRRSASALSTGAD